LRIAEEVYSLRDRHDIGVLMVKWRSGDSVEMNGMEMKYRKWY